MLGLQRNLIGHSPVFSEDGWVCARLKKDLDHIQVPGSRGCNQRCVPEARFLDIHLSSRCYEQFDALAFAKICGSMKAASTTRLSRCLDLLRG